MTPDPLLQPVAKVVAELERALKDGRRTAPNEVLGLVLELHESNLEQWGLEDVTRHPGAGDSVVADAKRAIDKLNLRRHGLIQAIDSAVDASLQQSDSAPLATESPGMVLDRLSVLVIRVARTRDRVGSEGEGTAVHARRLPSLERQLSALSIALETLIQEVGAGTRRFMLYEPMKLYSSPSVEAT